MNGYEVSFYKAVYNKSTDQNIWVWDKDRSNRIPDFIADDILYATDYVRKFFKFPKQWQPYWEDTNNDTSVLINDLVSLKVIIRKMSDSALIELLVCNHSKTPKEFLETVLGAVNDHVVSPYDEVMEEDKI